MKQTKKLIAPFLSLVAFLALGVGTTYALFTSETENDISISSGSVKVHTTISTGDLYSALAKNYYDAGTMDEVLETEEGNPVCDTDEDGNVYYFEKVSSFSNGGTAVVDTNTGILTLDKIMPGDKANFSITVVNSSSVNIKYRNLITLVENAGLFNALTVKIDSVTYNGYLSTGNDQWNTWAVSSDPTEMTKTFNLSVYLPLVTDTSYQNSTCKIKFNFEAIQGNAYASDDSLLNKANTLLRASNRVNEYPQAAIEEALEVTEQTNIEDVLVGLKDTVDPTLYAWNRLTDQFSIVTDTSSLTYNDYLFIDAADTLTANPYSCYLMSNTNNVTSITTNKGLDVGDIDTTTTISYDNTAALVGQEVIIRTNSNETSLTINGPLDTVHHYGVAYFVDIIDIANDSFHENGSTAVTTLTSGRFVIEEGGSTDIVFFEASEDASSNLYFDNIVICVEEGGTLPTISRSAVGTNIVDPILVAEVELGDGNSNFIYLNGTSTSDQIKVMTDDSTSTGATAPAFNASEAVNGNEIEDTNTAAIVNYLANVVDSSNPAQVHETGVETIEEVEQISSASARIDNKLYTSFTEAFDDAKDESTIYLFKNIENTAESDITSPLVVDDKSVTIEGFNNPKVSVDSDIKLFDVKNEGSLNVNNVSFDGEVTFNTVNKGIASSLDGETDTFESSEKSRTTPLFVVEAGGTLNLDGATFSGYDNTKNQGGYYINTDKATSIIRAYGSADTTTTVNINNSTFKENIGTDVSLVALINYVDCTITDTVICNNAVAKNSNHGLMCCYNKSTLTFNGNCDIYGNSYNGNGLISVIASSEANRAVININDNANIHDNYGGNFKNGAYYSNYTYAGRCGIFYIHNYGTLNMNGGTIQDNEIYSFINWGEAYEYGVNKVAGFSKVIAPIDLNSKTSRVTVSSNATIKNNYYYDKDETAYETAITFDLTTEFANGYTLVGDSMTLETLKATITNNGSPLVNVSNKFVSGYVGNAFPRKAGEDLYANANRTTNPNSLYVTETIEEQNWNK